jgi:hypothetical protein
MQEPGAHKDKFIIFRTVIRLMPGDIIHNIIKTVIARQLRGLQSKRRKTKKVSI